MKRTCPACKDEYEVQLFKLDGGCCPKHVRGFFSKPLWFMPCPEGTRSLWNILIVMHFICFFFTGLIDPPLTPIAIYCLAMFLYFCTRSVIGHHRGYPTLTKRQAIGLALLPIYGPMLAVIFFGLGQIIRYGL